MELCNSNRPLTAQEEDLLKVLEKSAKSLVGIHYASPKEKQEAIEGFCDQLEALNKQYGDVIWGRRELTLIGYALLALFSAIGVAVMFITGAGSIIAGGVAAVVTAPVGGVGALPFWAGAVGAGTLGVAAFALGSTAIAGIQWHLGNTPGGDKELKGKVEALLVPLKGLVQILKEANRDAITRGKEEERDGDENNSTEAVDCLPLVSFAILAVRYRFENKLLGDLNATLQQTQQTLEQIENNFEQAKKQATERIGALKRAEDKIKKVEGELDKTLNVLRGTEEALKEAKNRESTGHAKSEESSTDTDTE